MSGSLALREAAIAAVKTRLDAELDGVVVEASRRAPVDVDNETLPRVVVREAEGGIEADLTVTQVQPHYTIGLIVLGYAAGETDLAAEQALSVLQARVAAALSYWTPSEDGLGDLVELGSEITLYTTEDSARPAGDFTARFELLGVGETAAGPWSS